MIALKSETSSVYSNDDRICYSSSADLQYEYRSLPHRYNTSMAHNHAQCFDRPARTLLGSEQEIIDKSGDLNGTMSPRQETNAEAEERRRRSAAIARAEARLMGRSGHARCGRIPAIDGYNSQCIRYEAKALGTHFFR
jgi:hypothetical protein